MKKPNIMLGFFFAKFLGKYKLLQIKVARRFVYQ